MEDDGVYYRLDYVTADGRYCHDTTPELWLSLNQARAAVAKFRYEHPGISWRIVRLSTVTVEES